MHAGRAIAMNEQDKNSNDTLNDSGLSDQQMSNSDGSPMQSDIAG